MSKDVIVLCLDVGPSMNTSLDGGETALEKSITVARQITQQKMFAGSKDLLGLVLFGTADTDNELASDGEGYDNITVAYRPAQPNVDFLRFLTSQVNPGGVSADFIDAIVVALDVLVHSTGDIKRVGDKKIYLMTDAGSEYSDDQLDRICAGLQAQSVELIVVGPSIASDDADSQPPDGGGPPGPSHQPRPPSVEKKTAQQVAGEAVIGRLVEAVDGSCFSFNEALQVSTFIHKNAKKQTARFVGHLEIGNNLKIPCKMFTKVMVERPATWKKLSAVSQAADDGGSMVVSMQRTYHLNDEDETEVDKDNVAKGYRYGKSLVPISDADETAMKFEAQRGLSLMGFTKQQRVKQYQCVGTSVQVLVANPDDKNAGRAMSAFIRALYETNMVGIGRYVLRKDSQPKVVALVPKIKTDSECLLVLQLPYMEDMRQFVFGSLPGERTAPSAEQLDAMDHLITSMDLMTAEVDNEGNQCEALKPGKTCNPLLQRSFQCIAHRALNPNPNDPLPDMDESLKRLLQPTPSIVASCNNELHQVKDLFPLERVVKKTKDDNAAAQVWKQTSDMDLASAAKRPRAGNDDASGSDDVVDFSMASLVKGEVTKVGTTDPVGDYKSLIAKKRVSFAEACRQLHTITVDLVKDSFGDTLYSKAMECVAALREEAIKKSEPEVFNDILRALRGSLVGTRLSPFWDKVVTQGVSLISTVDCGVSKVTQEQAAEFIEAGPEAVSMAMPQDDEDMEDPDNLLELM